MGLIKITDDLGDAKRCYLESINKHGKCVIRRDHTYKTWLVERYCSENTGRMKREINEILSAFRNLTSIKNEISKKIRVMKDNSIGKNGTGISANGKPAARKASSSDILGFTPGNAPRLHRRIRPFCGTNEEIRRLRRGY